LTKANLSYRKFLDRFGIEFEDLTKDLKYLDIETSVLEQYTYSYLTKYLNNIEYEIGLNSRLVHELFKGIEAPLEELTVLDIGGGVGIVSMMLVSMGVGRVIYLDQNPVVKRDAEILATRLNRPAHEYVSASLEDMPKEVSESIDLAISRDVIEHVYDLGALDFGQSRCPLLQRMVHNTSANMYCIWLKGYFREVHREAEKEGVISTAGAGGFWQVRYEYIKKELGITNEVEATKLASATRGLSFNDLNQYVDHGKYPHDRFWPENTCDPSNGNWSERLIPIEEYRKWADRNEFSMNLKGGILNGRSGGLASKWTKGFLNTLITNNMSGPSLWPSLTIILDRPSGA